MNLGMGVAVACRRKCHDVTISWWCCVKRSSSSCSSKNSCIVKTGCSKLSARPYTLYQLWSRKPNLTTLGLSNYIDWIVCFKMLRTNETCSKTKIFDTRSLGLQIDRPPLLHPAHESKTVAPFSRETVFFWWQTDVAWALASKASSSPKEAFAWRQWCNCRSIAKAQHTPHRDSQTVVFFAPPSLVRPLMWKIQLKTHCIPSNLPCIN